MSNDYPSDGLRKTPPPVERASSHADATAEARAAATAPRIPAAALPGYSTGDVGDPPHVQARPRSLSPEAFQAELQRIEMDLSVMVIEEPSVWTFDSLRERTNYLLDAAQTAVERGRARLLADKIARFDDIKRRQEAVLAMRDRTDRNGRLWAGLRARDDRPTAAKVRVDDRFDGVGRLTQVVSPKPGAPRYALMDESGDVRCYVTPAPGVNLHGLMGQEVGVIGTRGYMPEQHAGHIMARRVAPLEGSLLR